MDSIFGPDGILATHLDGYESRPGQMAMAKAIEQLLYASDEDMQADQAASLVVEAETGLGKTLAYLIPAVQSGKRVVISTNTRNLQDQILHREIPLIQQYIDPDLKALCVKGRQNYLCLYRWRQLQAGRQTDLFDDGDDESLEPWIETTIHGDRSELTWLAASSPLWQKICCLSHFCLGTSCPEATGCFLNRLRRDAAASRVLIVNHHLLFSDLAVRKTGYGEVLPRYETVIFDEAHHVENVATTFFGFTFSRYQIIDLTSDVERSATIELAGKRQQGVLKATTRLVSAIDRFVATFPGERGRFLLDPLMRNQPEILTLRHDLLTALEHLAKTLDPLAAMDGPWQQYADRTQDLTARLNVIMAERVGDLTIEEVRYTYWFERSERNLTLFATPVDVAAELQSTLFALVRHCVFTSATLTTGGNFGYFLERLGLAKETPTLSLASPFDYRQRTLVYIPDTRFPEPTGVGYQQALHASMETLITHAKGRTLVLFTSLAAMDNAYHNLRDRLSYPLLLQGDAPRRKLLRQFSQDTHSVLFAVASFWEGVDIPGESLSLVIMDKLPFEVPSDPVIMARINRIQSLGGKPFFDFQVPRAILTLRQGAGRLMRTATDSGVIAILDTRLFTKGYGRQFLKSLPPSPVTRDLEDVAAFFNDRGTA